MAKKVYKSTVELTVETKDLPVKSIEAYRCTEAKKESRKEVRVVVWEGICSKGDARAVGMSMARQPKWCLLRPEDLEGLRRYGWTMPRDEAYDEFIVNRFSKTPFSDWGKKDWKLVRVESGDHMIFDQDGLALPVGQTCEYIMWNMDNEHYELDKAFEILSRHPEVEDLRRFDIPYYNREKGRTKSLAFRWVPTVDSYREIWSWCLKNESKYPSTEMPRAARALDLFGLRAVEKEPRWW